MKKVLLLCMSVVMFASGIRAQCTTCVPSFSGCSPTGGICGHAAVGMANHPYQSNISFYMPKSLNDPSILSQCSCSQVDLNQIRITGVGGLPTGLNISYDRATPLYNVQGGDSLGCANFCGTPLAAGVYPVTIYIEARVLARGTPIGNVDPGPQSQTYKDTIIILPDTSGGISSFNYTPHVKSDCDSLRLAFNALLSAPAPNPTGYVWNFGNGQTSNALNPAGTQFYNTPGVYPVSLRTTYYQYRVKKVYINNISGGYSDICDISCTGTPPDIYIKLPLLGFNNESSQISQCSNILFDNLNQLIPMGTTSLSLEVWDDDASSINACGADDNIGNYTVNINTGIYPLQVNFGNGNASGYVEIDTVSGISFTDTLKLEIQGRPATPVVVVTRDSICKGDSTLLVITPSYANVQYEWWRDSVYLLTATDSVFYAKDAGFYKVKITNLATGCASMSDTPGTRLHVSGNVPLFANVVYSSGSQTLFLNPFPTGGATDWYFNNVPISGQHGGSIPSLGPGVYKVDLYPAGYPACSVTSADVTVTNVGIEEIGGDVSDLSVYPNPNNGSFSIRASVITPGEVSLKITDMLGREVYQKTVLNQNGGISENIDITSLAKDVYTVQVSTPSGKATNRVVVK